MEYVATIGSFDGVHRGHRCLLNQVLHIAKEHDLKAMAITFRMSPKKVLGTSEESQLTSVEERVSLLHQIGVDKVEVLDFTQKMAAMTAHDFMQQVLKEQLGVKVLVIGYDHRFGHGRSEGFDDYVHYGKNIGIKVVRSEVYIDGSEPISSSRIRHLLSQGDVKGANLLLGYSYVLNGRVVDGYKVGRKIGFPTANMIPLSEDILVPADGVYAVWVSLSNENCDGYPIGNNTELSTLNSRSKHVGMLNIGYRPTLNNGRERSIEVHILDFEGSLYGKSISVEFVHRLREEQTFASLDELIKQLETDKQRIRKLLFNNKM